MYHLCCRVQSDVLTCQHLQQLMTSTNGAACRDASAVVYQAWDRTRCRRVAIKVLSHAAQGYSASHVTQEVLQVSENAVIGLQLQSGRGFRTTPTAMTVCLLTSQWPQLRCPSRGPALWQPCAARLGSNTATSALSC